MILQLLSLIALALPAQYVAEGTAAGDAPGQRFPITVTNPGTNYPQQYLRLRWNAELFTYWGSQNHTPYYLYQSGYVDVHFTVYMTETSTSPIISTWGGHAQQPFWTLINPYSSYRGLSQGEPVTNTGTGQICSFPHNPSMYFGGHIEPQFYGHPYTSFWQQPEVTLWVEMQVTTNVVNSYNWMDFSGNPPHISTRLMQPSARVGLTEVWMVNE